MNAPQANPWNLDAEEKMLELLRLQRESYLAEGEVSAETRICLLYTSPSPRDRTRSRMPSSA